MEGIIEQFLNWTKRKIFHHLNEVSEKQVFYREKEIWWTALGQNIGYEINGKNELYERPVLILKKYNADTCFVLPFTTQIKHPVPWYQIFISPKLGAVNLTQGRTISSKRLLRRYEMLGGEKYEQILQSFIKQFVNK